MECWFHARKKQVFGHGKRTTVSYTHLVANGCIPKPTFWTFAFFKKLKEKKGICVYKDETCVVMKYEDGSYRGIAWNATRNRSGKDLCLNLTIPTTQSASTDAYLFLTQIVDEENCNPLKVWHDLGEPANPTKRCV